MNDEYFPRLSVNVEREYTSEALTSMNNGSQFGGHNKSRGRIDKKVVTSIQVRCVYSCNYLCSTQAVQHCLSAA